MTAHILAQLLDSPVLDAGSKARFHELLRREGRDLPTMVRQGTHAPLRWFRAVYPDLDADHAAALGYAAGEQARLTSYTPLSLPLVSAPTIEDALRLLVFLPLISNSVSARFVERGDDLAMVLTASSNDPVLDRFPVFYCAAALVRLLHLLSAEPLELSVHIGWPQPAGFVQRPECKAGRLRFDAPLHHVVVPRSTLRVPCRFADPIAYQTEWASLQGRMASLGLSDDIVERIRGLLDAAPGLLSLEDAAGLLNMSASTLKRRLAEAGTGFREVRESALWGRAMLLLTDATLSLDSIASTLGYSDLANFSHAFKRWTRVSPGAFRANSVARSSSMGSAPVSRRTATDA